MHIRARQKSTSVLCNKRCLVRQSHHCPVLRAYAEHALHYQCTRAYAHLFLSNQLPITHQHCSTWHQCNVQILLNGSPAGPASRAAATSRTLRSAKVGRVGAAACSPRFVALAEPRWVLYQAPWQGCSSSAGLLRGVALGGRAQVGAAPGSTAGCSGTGCASGQGAAAQGVHQGRVQRHRVCIRTGCSGTGCASGQGAVAQGVHQDRV